MVLVETVLVMAVRAIIQVATTRVAMAHPVTPVGFTKIPTTSGEA